MAPSSAETTRLVTSSARWAEQRLTTPRPEAGFPWRTFIAWLLPGLIAAIGLTSLYAVMEQRASRPILYRTLDDRLAMVRSDATGQEEVPLAGFEGADFGDPHWSPQGTYYAAVADQRRLVIAQPGIITPTVLAAQTTALALVGQPWSADGSSLALVGRTTSARPAVLIADVVQQTVTDVELDLVPNTPLHWSPVGSELLVTAYTDAITPSLQIVSASGGAALFAPSDNQSSRSFGTWSPDGSQVAYIASVRPEVGGSVWVAARDGSGPRQLVPDGLNSAPIWSPANDAIFFSRLLTETQELILYQVDLNGQGLIELGRSSKAYASSERDYRTLIDWAPDGSLFFQGTDQQGRTIVYVRKPGAGQLPTPVLISEASDLSVRWSPTSRGLLISESFSRLQLHWIDADRPPVVFPLGQAPSWQPTVQ